MRLITQVLFLVFFPILSAIGAEKKWVQTSYRDFLKGNLTDGGANTYISADGAIRLIHHRDLNGDGTADLVLPSTHDNNFAVDSYLYWGGESGYQEDKKALLPGNGAVAAIAEDLNKDGFLDIVLANQFNGTKTELNSMIYWGGPQGCSKEKKTEIPTLDATGVAAADLNADGFVDLVFASGGRSYQFSREPGDFTVRRTASDIFWGSQEGFSVERTSPLLTFGARDVEIQDLNKDGTLDIIIAESGEGGKLGGGVRLYYGTKAKMFSADLMSFLPGLNVVAVSIADVNKDGFPDILLANEGKQLITGPFEGVESYPIVSIIYWGSDNGFGDSKLELGTSGARDVKAADLNQDGVSDIIFANKLGGASVIYWGEIGPDGQYKTSGRQLLPTLNASHVETADLNRDGHLDLVFCNENDSKRHEITSFIYWNSETGFDAAKRSEIPTLGGRSALVKDFNKDDHADLFVVNGMDGTAGAPVETYIYWGSMKGDFSTDNRQTIEAHNLMGYSIADLDLDGVADLVLVGKELTVFWGKDNHSRSDATHLPVHYGISCSIADFNRDGWLDLSVSDLTGSTREDGILIYWGGPSGFFGANRQFLSWPAIRGHALADLNGDGNVDVVASAVGDAAVIFWNSSDGFDSSRKTLLPSKLAVAVEIADLNHDKYLDIILCNIFDREKVALAPGIYSLSTPAPQFIGFHAGTDIYWGGPEGYSEQRRASLPTVGSEDAVANDLNGDGWLDLVISSYHAGSHRNHPSWIFWGTPEGPHPGRYTLLPTESASGVQVNDYNDDGWKDIFFVCHTEGTNHRTDSFLYWGSQNGFDPKKKALIPTVGVHFLTMADVGDIFHRRDHFEFISESFDAGAGAVLKKIDWKAMQPFKTAVRFQLRHAMERDKLEHAPWTGPAGSETFYREPGEELNITARWVQYKVTLFSPRGANSPALEEVEIYYDTKNNF